MSCKPRYLRRDFHEEQVKIMHIEKLTFTGDNMSAVEALVQLDQDPKLKKKVRGFGSQGILLWQQGQRAIRFYPNTSFCVKAASVTDENGDDDSEWFGTDDLLADIAKGGTTIAQWLERFGEPDDLENGIYSTYDKPYFQLTNASGNPIGSKMIYLPKDYLSLASDQNTAGEAFDAFINAWPECDDSTRAVTKTDRFADGSIIEWFYPDERMPVPSRATYYAPNEATITGRRFINLSKAQMDVLITGNKS